MLYKDKNKNEILLLCACKNYLKGQKNGILLIYNFNSEKDCIRHKFYPTDKFEVHCFCQILFKSDNDNVNILKPNNNIDITNYFLVGGFDNAKIRGSIQLYKINKINKNYKEIFEIEKIQDIVFSKTKRVIGKIQETISQKELEIEKNKIKKKTLELEIQDMISKIKFKGIKGAISCIEQSKENGNVYITSLDGNIFLFDKPNLQLLDSISSKQFIKELI